jgi:hypothetical protein
MGQKRERRSCTRTPFLTDVTLRLGDVDTGIEAVLLDISISGMFIRIDQIIPVGTLCTIEIRVTGNHSRLLLEDIQGEVVRQDEHGVAIHFDSKMEWFIIFKVYTHCCREEIEKVGGNDSEV